MMSCKAESLRKNTRRPWTGQGEEVQATNQCFAALVTLQQHPTIRSALQQLLVLQVSCACLRRAAQIRHAAEATEQAQLLLIKLHLTTTCCQQTLHGPVITSHKPNVTVKYQPNSLRPFYVAGYLHALLRPWLHYDRSDSSGRSGFVGKEK